MPKFINEKDYVHGTPPKVGILLCNLGSPDSPETGAVRRYLAEFLIDPRVVEVPRLLWRVVLHGIILRFRPKRSAHAYKKVWTDKGSPLITISQSQGGAVAQALAPHSKGEISVQVAMRYGQPSIAFALEQLRKDNVRKLLVLPLYPQYCAVTTASTFDAVAAVFTRARWIPDLRMVGSYHDHPGYISALAASVRSHWNEHGRGAKLLMSFHGIPQRYLINGDPYHCQCQVTARLLASELDLSEDQWHVSFQSRLGREPWLAPYTDKVLSEWAAQKVGDIDTICPGFAADCLETLEEMVMQYGEQYLQEGGGTLRYIACLNDSAEHIQFLSQLAKENLHPWIEQKQSAATLAASRDRALELGAKA